MKGTIVEISRNVVRASLAALVFSLSAAAAEEMWLVRDGKPIEKNMVQADLDPVKNPYWKGWTQRKGKTVDGIFCPDLTPSKSLKHSKNILTFVPNKSALGDCEFSVTFKFDIKESLPRAYSGPRGPKILIADRGAFGFWSRGNRIAIGGGKGGAIPLKDFGMASPVNLSDGKMHTLSVKRNGDILAFLLDGKVLKDQKIDPEVNLIFSLHPFESRPRIASMKLVSERFSDKLTTDFKSAAPIEMLFVGAGRPTTEPGKACAYRIPALLVTKKGTLVAFAEARRDSGRDNADIDIVLKRSTDNGKTWGPEIKVLDQGRVTSGNPCPVVLESGRILLLTCWNAHGAGEAGRRVFITHSDDDGKTWSKPREITRQAKKPGWHWYATGPGAGAIQLTRGKHKGRVIVPCDTSVGRSYYSHIIYSDDDGENWKVGAVSPVGLNECQAVELANGDVMINSRNHRHAAYFRGVNVSHDGGETFDPKLFRRDPALVEPHCQASLRRYSWPKGEKPGLILYSGPGLRKARAQGTLRGSYDEGKTWPWQLQYYQGPSGYSDIAVLPDGRVAVLFEKGGKSKLGFMILPAPPGAPPAKPAK